MRISNLLHSHLLENFAGELLQLPNLNGSALEPEGVAGGCAELADRAESSTGESQGVIREDGLGSSVVVLVLNLVDEGSDVDSYGTGLLAGAVRAFHAP
jgi:hypothetical protein